MTISAETRARDRALYDKLRTDGGAFRERLRTRMAAAGFVPNKALGETTLDEKTLQRGYHFTEVTPTGRHGSLDGNRAVIHIHPNISDFWDLDRRGASSIALADRLVDNALSLRRLALGTEAQT